MIRKAIARRGVVPGTRPGYRFGRRDGALHRQREEAMRYLYRRGRGANRRVMHLCGYDPRSGEPTMLPLCDAAGLFDTTSNFALGRPTCKRCHVEADQ